MTRRKILIKDAIIVTMDPILGDLPKGDILVEDGRIAAIGPRIDSESAEITNAAGRIVIPGFVNAHHHTWQTALRGAASNWTLLEYFRWVHAGLATAFTPDDIHIATFAGALNQIHCGTTTLGDWCHNNPTPAHTDAAIAGLQRSGIRAVFFHGSPKPDPKPGTPHFSEVPHPRAEIERLTKSGTFGSGSKLSLAMAILGPHYSTLDVARADFRLAREFGLIASMHQGGGPAKAPDGWDVLERDGLIDARTNIVHGNDLTDARLARFLALGASFSVAPENEMIQGHGHPIIGRLRALGGLPSIGTDLESVLSGGMMFATRIALSHQRALDNAASRERHGTIPPTSTITVHEALSWATLGGARALGLEDQIGSLTPGKVADLIVFNTESSELWPVHDPVATVVMQAHPGHVESVMIDGQWRKRDGRLVDVDLTRVRPSLEASGRRILASMGWTARQG